MFTPYLKQNLRNSKKALLVMISAAALLAVSCGPNVTSTQERTPATSENVATAEATSEDLPRTDKTTTPTTDGEEAAEGNETTVQPSEDSQPDSEPPVDPEGPQDSAESQDSTRGPTETENEGSETPDVGPPSSGPSETPVPTPGKKIVHLTFDDGPYPLTPKFLDLLKRYDITATWFVTGESVTKRPAIAKEIVANGHAIANHTYNHPRLPEADTNQELVSTQTAIQEVTGVVPTCYRPPYGAADANVREIATSLGLKEWRWDTDTFDWKADITAEEIIANLNKVETTEPRRAEGVLVLMHDGGGVRETTYAALAEWLEVNADKYDFQPIAGC